MSEPNDTPPNPEKKHTFLVPSPHTTRRNRTASMSERAAAGPSFTGTVKEFCREKGHGFIVPDNEDNLLFCHVSDIDEEYVPKAGDRVSFKKLLIPPKNVKYQATHVMIVTPVEGVKHERWDAGLQSAK